MAIPGMQRPADILTVLADPEKFKQAAEKLQFLRDEAEGKLEMLRTKKDVDEYVKSKRKEVDSRIAKLANDQGKATLLLKEAEEKHKEAQEHFDAASISKQKFDDDQQALKAQRTKFERQCKEREAEIHKQAAALDKQREQLAGQRKLLSEQSDYLKALAAEVSESIKNLPR
jgi:chromosome segregation ATPase